jgi:hypothetical protein
VHYFPAISGFIAHFLFGTTPIADARAVTGKVLTQSEQKPWTLTYVHAAIRAWWLAEYSDYFTNNHESNLTQSQLEEGWFTSLKNTQPDTDTSFRESRALKAFHRCFKRWRF